MNERPLVAFTLLGQAAVGAFITLGAIDLWAGGLAGARSAHVLVDGVLLSIGPVMFAALLLSVLHLGSPTRAWRAVTNLQRSWLSREIFLALAFTAAGGLSTALRMASGAGVVLRSAAAVVAAALGLALVYAMVRVYRLRTVPAWDSPFTAISFFATALLLGTLGVGTGLVLDARVPAGLAAPPLHALALAAALGFGAELAAPGRGGWHAARRLLLLAGLACAVLFLLSAGHAAALLVTAFAAALAAQALGRYLFYVEGPRREL